MLVNLHIENVAVIEQADIEFQQGLNVLTGETGAGKSIVIDSINAILGERMNRELIRTGASRARVGALFSSIPSQVMQKMAEAGVEAEEDDTLLLQREITSEGKSIFRINGRPVTASILKSVSHLLLNIHGQHENQELLSPHLHMQYLDQLGDLDGSLQQYRIVYEQAVRLKRELSSMQMDDAEKERRMDLLRYQIDELENANLRVGEQEELAARRTMILNAEKIAYAVQKARFAVNGGEEEQGAAQLLTEAGDALDEIAGLYQPAKKIAAHIHEVSYALEDLAAELRECGDSVDYQPAELNDIEERLDLLYRLSLKYGHTEQEMIDYLSKIRTELDTIQFSEERQEALFAEYRETAHRAKELAERLSEQRKNVAVRFASSVQNELSFLNMPDVQLSVEQKRCKLNAFGCDEIQFLISTNPGEPPKPIAKIASGGELSRIMLAIKNVLAEKDGIGTLIFDEIDTGISGRAAQKVGVKLWETSRGKQVICVTHLAQIAAQADCHFLIQKNVRDGRTFTEVKALTYEGRQQELARIMGGAEITALQLDSAAELLRLAGHGLPDENDKKG